MSVRLVAGFAGFAGFNPANLKSSRVLYYYKWGNIRGCGGGPTEKNPANPANPANPGPHGVTTKHERTDPTPHPRQKPSLNPTTNGTETEVRTFDTNSVINMTTMPPGWMAAFKAADGQTWTEPVIALATLINWVEDDTEAGDRKTDTRIEPVVVDSHSGYPVTATDYVGDRSGVTFEGMRPTGQLQAADEHPDDPFAAPRHP